MHKIKENIFWVGSIDWDLRNFHGYDTPSGSTYNSYLILDEKPTLIDAVKSYGSQEMITRIKEIIDPAKIQYIVSNHTEMDHSGAIDELLKYCPNAQIVCSPKGEEGLKRHFKKNWKFKVVQTGDVLDIGKRKLKFFLMPMVHWPDSMATYLESDAILFSNDAFGQHYASSERYVDEVGLDIAIAEATKYYANIVLPFGAQVLKVLDVIKDLKIETICPSHGLIWRKPDDIKKIVASYQKWALYQSDKKVLIVYDTMWHSTEMMAKYLFTALDKEGISVKLMNLQTAHISDVVTDIMLSQMILLGTPMLNNHMLPSMASLMMYMKGLKPKNRYGFTFGSYGWSTVGFKELESSCQEAGLELISDGNYIKFIPDAEELKSLDKTVSLIKNKLNV
ncbi:MAG TPA: FprA family A-type flavoprotein [Candidatus Omnitrophota bacterium]|nr:FprA family A-type flavoprotein [Candidatus Omnitrophota bacterium]